MAKHMSEKTVFQMIIDGELPCVKVYEDDTVLAFLDIEPIQPGHTLVIPKHPSIDSRQADPEIFSSVMKAAQKIAQAQTKILKCDGVNICMNCGEAAGQEVFHTHVHVIPRYENDDVMPQAMRGEYGSDEEKDQVGEAIKGAL